METRLQVLTEEEKSRVHETSLNILEKTGVRVLTETGRRILKDAGAEVDENSGIVKFPVKMVEASLKLAPKAFSLGARRPGSSLTMNSNDTTLCLDGSGTMVIDRTTGNRRPATYMDWQNITRLADAIDEIGVYWSQVEPADRGETLYHEVDYMCRVFRNFSKHVQDTISSKRLAPWMAEILQVVFGSREEIRKIHPVSYLLCPQSPLMIDRDYTDAYLALKGLHIPVAVMPMPLMGATAPASMIATIVQGNCEVLSMLCLLQAHEPGVPFIYAPVLAVMNPRSGALQNASMAYSIMGAAATEMGRYYHLPTQSSPGSSDAHVPDIQCATEGAAMALPTALSWPDIIVGPGMLDGSMVSSLEQLLLDVEIFRYARQAHQGVDTKDERWLTEVIHEIGPGGEFLTHPSTLNAVREREFSVSKLGCHTDYETWEAEGKKEFYPAIQDRVDQILTTHQPMPLDEEIEVELEKICHRAKKQSN
jgi:trimethylamine---corrinoid protein Co-methyltransferase